MVPNIALKKRNYTSVLKTLNNIFEELLKIAKDMQKSILSQNWDRIYDLSRKQEELNLYFNNSLITMEHNDPKKYSNDLTKDEQIEISLLRSRLKTKISKYKDIELINAKLLNDNLFVAKHKVDNIFNTGNKKDTYNKEMKKESELWEDKPVMLSKLA
jgi:hypothetical protein